jgi:tetratricopeptide (TPR) repeat protein
MPSRINLGGERATTPPNGSGGNAPLLTARMHLDGGFRYEQAGATHKAIAAYEAALSASATPVERAEAHLRLARVYRTGTDWDAAIAASRVAVRLAEDAGSDDLVAEAMNVEVGVYQLRGEFDAGDALAVAALARARSPRVRGILLQNRGAMAAQLRDFAAAKTYFAESVSAFEEAGYELGMAFALNNAAAAARDAGDPTSSLELAQEAAALSRRLGAFDVLTLAVQNQAYALVALGRPDEAEAPLGEVLGHFTVTANVLRQAECLEVMGSLYALRSEYADTAVRCYDLARTLAVRVGARSLAERVANRIAGLPPTPSHVDPRTN